MNHLYYGDNLQILLRLYFYRIYDSFCVFKERREKLGEHAKGDRRDGGQFSHMSPRRVAPADGSQAQEEMTVVILKIKGDSGTLQKGFDALQQAFAALAPSHSRTRSIGPHQLPAADGQVIENNEEHPPGEPALGEDSAQEPPPPAKAKRSPSAPRSTYMDDFDLSPLDVPSLKDYCSEKGPSNGTGQVPRCERLDSDAWRNRSIHR